MAVELLRIIFIDDSMQDVELEEYELRKGGLAFSSIRVETQPDLLRAIGEFKPGLIISDYTLPTMDGLSALEIARRTAPETPFIFVSGTIGEERAVDCLKKGATDYVVKGRIGGLIYAVQRAIKEAEDRDKERKLQDSIKADKPTEPETVSEKLLLSEERFQAVTRSAGEMIYEWDVDSGIVDLRGNVDPNTDYDPSVSRRAHKTWEAMLHPEDRSRVLEAVQNHLESGEQFHEEYRIVRKDGSVRHWMDRGSLIGEGGKSPRRWIGVVTDVTDQKKVERMKDELISTVSHELRTPLTSIRGALGLVTSGVLGDLPGKALSLLFIAQRNCVRLVRIIDELLDLRKLESGKLSLKLSPIPIFITVEGVVEAHRPEATLAGVTLHLEGLNENPQVSADPERLAQVLTHLLSNATKFSSMGGRVVISVIREPGLVRVSVSDQGPGIPENFRNRIFQRFAQADASASRTAQGTGLGLSVSKQLVEAMGGSIGFESEIGKGSTFFVTLPAHPS